MKQERVVNLLVLFALIATGVVWRWLGPDEDWSFLPANFTPTAALVLFAGFYFRQFWMALCVPVAILVVSNFRLDSHTDRYMLAAVYACHLFPLMLRGVLRKGLSPGRVVLCAALPSVPFFLITNLIVWIFGYGYDVVLYEHTAAGLVDCYVQALPFFRNMLAGDLLFTAAIFGGYRLAVDQGYATMPYATAPVLENARL